MVHSLRKSGISILDSIPWGSHLCLFYGNSSDLIEIAVPYLKEGLEKSESCLWITSDDLSAQEASDAMRKAISDMEKYFLADLKRQRLTSSDMSNCDHECVSNAVRPYNR